MIHPFKCVHSESFPDILERANASLVLSTYQAGKVILLHSNGKGNVVQTIKTFDSPMGLAYQDGKLAVATTHSIEVLKADPYLSAMRDDLKGVNDYVFVPRSSHYTGKIDTHDMCWLEDKLFGVNTSFSCISLINDDFSFTPVWKPRFISSLKPIDKCHLNGMAIDKEGVKYVTALGGGDSKRSWSTNRNTEGVLIDVPSGEIAASGLAMPHSPRVYDEGVFVLQSATGELLNIDIKSGKSTSVCKINGFVRGMDKIGNCLFIGVSRMRKDSPTFKGLPIASSDTFAGVVVVDVVSGAVLGYVKYDDSVEEIYDVKVMPDIKRPTMFTNSENERKELVSLRGESYWFPDKKNSYE